MSQDITATMAPSPAWYNSMFSGAVSPHGVQVGSICGLHAVNHLLAADVSLNNRKPLVLTTEVLESVALEARLGDARENLYQPGHSNYDIAVLTTNCTKLGLSVFPLTPVDIEGSVGRTSVVAGSRLVKPFDDYIVREGIHTTIGYLLRLPSHGGHWVCLLPGAISAVQSDPSVDALLCDSLYSSLFLLRHEHTEQLLLACAVDAAHNSIDEFRCEFGCFLVGRRQ
jgi:hypothetical protein